MGLKSTAITWKDSPKNKMGGMIALSLALSCSLALVSPSYWVCLPGFFLSYGYLAKALYDLDINDRAACGRFFKKNNYVGILIFLSLLSRGVVEEYSKKT